MGDADAGVETVKPQYEFDDAENLLFDELAKVMRLVGALLIVVGVVTLGLAALLLLKGSITTAFASVVQGISSIVIGGWTRSAASSFARISTTEGNDIPLVLGAVSDLRKIYGLQKLVLLISLGVIVLGVAMVFFAAIQ